MCRKLRSKLHMAAVTWNVGNIQHPLNTRIAQGIQIGLFRLRLGHTLLFPLHYDGWNHGFSDYYDVTFDLFAEMSSLSFHPIRHFVAMLSQIAFGLLGVFNMHWHLTDKSGLLSTPSVLLCRVEVITEASWDPICIHSTLLQQWLLRWDRSNCFLT